MPRSATSAFGRLPPRPAGQGGGRPPALERRQVVALLLAGQVTGAFDKTPVDAAHRSAAQSGRRRTEMSAATWPCGAACRTAKEGVPRGAPPGTFHADR